MSDYRVSNGVIRNVHSPSVCAGEFCCIHNPSNHHMAEWPQAWREDRYLMERICPHGIGHPDPDDLNPDITHGCDGCCAGGSDSDIPPAERAALMKELRDELSDLADSIEYVQGILEDLADLGETPSTTGEGRLLPSTYAKPAEASSTGGENNPTRGEHRGAENNPGGLHRTSSGRPVSIQPRPKHPWTQSLTRVWWTGWGR